MSGAGNPEDRRRPCRAGGIQAGRWRGLCAALVAGLLAGEASAGLADVLSASADCSAERVCSFRVTVRHADEGWNHYADGWEVVAPDGRVLATRVLRHPHLDEQPFTRGLSGARIPEGIDRVRVRARDSLHGLGGAEVCVEIGPPGAGAVPAASRDGAPRHPAGFSLADGIQILLFTVFSVLLAGVAWNALRRILRIQRRYSDPAFVARALAEEARPEAEAGREERRRDASA